MIQNSKAIVKITDLKKRYYANYMKNKRTKNGYAII